MPELIEKAIVVALFFSMTALAQTEPSVKFVSGTSGAHKSKPAAIVEASVEAPPPAPVSIPSMTLEELPALAPRVVFSGGELTIDATNATLVNVLHAIQAKTGVVIDIPPGGSSERVAVHLSGRPDVVIPALLDGSKFGYVIRASPDDPEGVQEVLLTKKLPSGTQPGQQTETPPTTSQRVVPMLVPAGTTQAAAEPIVAMDEPDKADEGKTQPAEAPAPTAAVVEEPHPAPPIQASAVSQGPEKLQDTNRQFLQNMYRARQQMRQPQPSQQEQSQ